MAVPRSGCRATIRRFELAAALLLAACAALEADLAPARESWQGARYEDVEARWGKPARGDGQTYLWVSESYRKVRPSVDFGIGVGAAGPAAGAFASLPFGNTGEPVRCDRRLTFAGGVVVEQRWTGPPDYCRTFAR